MRKTIDYLKETKWFWIAAGVLTTADLSALSYNKKHANEEEDNSADIKRVKVSKFQGLKEKFKEIKFDFYNIQGIEWKGLFFASSFDDYWIDGAAYEVSNNKFSDVITSTYQLHNMCLEATDFAIKDDEILQKVFDIPSDLIPMIRKSWERREVDLMSRYDFLMDKNGQLLFLECNGDTPSGILEAGPAQREWASYQQKNQFNTLESNLRDGFERILRKTNKSKICFFNNGNLEDDCTQSFLESLVNGKINQASQQSSPSSIQTRNENISQFDFSVTPNEYNSTLFWRQYPLEWLASESPRTIFQNTEFFNHPQQLMVEPAWKIIMSNKAMSVLLKAMYPKCELLIDTQLQPFSLDSLPFLSKQKYAREGEHIAYCENMDELEQKSFLKSAFFGYIYPPIFQRFISSNLHSTRYITVSSWIVHGKPCGLLLREDLNKITGTGSSVLPYYLRDIGARIKLNLENSQLSSYLRQSIYGTQTIDSNTPLVSLTESMSEIHNDYGKKDLRAVKKDIMEQYDMLMKMKQKLFDIPQENLEEEELWDKNNPILIGFQPFQGDQSLIESTRTENNENRHVYSGGSGGGNLGGSSSSYSSQSPSGSTLGETALRANSKVSVHSAGTTGRTASSHS